MRSRLLLAAASALVALLLALGLWLVLGRARGTPPPLAQVVDADPDLEADEWHTRQRRFDQANPPRWVQHFEDSTLRWERLGREAVLRIRPQLAQGGGIVLDEYSLFRRSPNLRTQTNFPEHPDGHWWLVTNQVGLRMDRPARQGNLEFVVLTSGDSHSEGACNNAESWSQRLGARLDGMGLSQSTDVVNASCAGYTLYNYLGVLERFLADANQPKPHVFAVAVYGGNDLLELLPLRHYFARRPRPPGHGKYTADIAHLRRDHAPAMAQVFEQILYFRHNPGELEEAVEGAVEVLHEIGRLCASEGIRFVPMWLPTAADLEWDRHGEVFDAIAADVDLEPHWRQSARHLGERIRAQTEGLDWLDLGPTLQSLPEGAFWVLDKHLNLAGQRAVEELLFERLGERGLLPAAGSPPPGGGAHPDSGR